MASVMENKNKTQDVAEATSVAEVTIGNRYEGTQSHFSYLVFGFRIFAFTAA